MEGGDRFPNDLGRRGYQAIHDFKSPEDILDTTAGLMEEWASRGTGRRPTEVDRRLEFARWSEVTEEVGGNNAPSTTGGKVGEYRMAIQLYHPSKHIGGRRTTERSRYDWLVVKDSELPGAGLGLFAARHYSVGALVTAYVGNLCKPGRDDSRQVHFGSQAIDVKPDTLGRRRYLFGAHFLNNPYYGMSVERRNAYELEWAGKKHNAEFDGLRVRASSIIRKGDEILLDYSGWDRTPETQAELDKQQRERAQNAKRRWTGPKHRSKRSK